MHCRFFCFSLLLLTLRLFDSCQAIQIGPESYYRGRNFTHIELYTASNGVEYIVLAQPDQLINLRADFSEAYVTVIGPRNDSSNCLPHQVKQGLAKCNIGPMTNHVKAMSVKSGYLYFCMTYLCGSCAKTPLIPDSRLAVDFERIDSELRQATRAVLCRDPSAKTTLTVAPKYHSMKLPPEDGLYLAMPFCIAKNLNLESSVESVMSIVSLKTLQPFKIGDFSPFWSEVIPSSNKRKQDVLSYHYSFNYNTSSYNYVYYLLTAKSVLQSDFSEMRVGRFCTKDLYLSGYVEVFITCNLPDADPKVRFGYFGEAATFVRPGRQLAQSLNASADEPVLFYTARVLDQELKIRQGVCAVPIGELNRRLDAIITDCGRGRAYHGPSYIRQHFPCSDRGGISSVSGSSSDSSSSGPPYCTVSSGLQTEWTGTVDSMGGRHTYHARFLAEVDPAKELLTALAAKPVYNGRTALFVGTSRGALLRYSVGGVDEVSTIASTLYDRTDVAEGSQESVLELRAGAGKLFALTASRVSSHPYAYCESRYKTCQECLESRDPHCVWSNRNTVGCLTWQKADQPDRDIITSAAECLQVSSVINSAINVETNVTDASVSLVVTKEPNVIIYCYYMHADSDRTVFETRPAQLTPYQAGFGISCRVSVPELRIYLGAFVSRNLTVRLSSAPSDATHYLVSVVVQVYSCVRHPNCTRCLGSSAPCRWLPRLSRCNAAADSTTAEAKVASVDQCPAVRPLQRLVLPSGYSQDLAFSLTGYHPEFMKRFVCELRCSEKSSELLTLNARNLSDTHGVLRCSVTELSYPESDPFRICKLKIVWLDGLNSDGSLDFIEGADSGGLLRLYKCHEMASQCDDCTLYTDEIYRCVWCVNSSRCSHSCPPDSWPAVNRGGVCSAPKIRRVEPAKLTEFVEGLQLNVSGTNLGNSVASIRADLVGNGLSLNCRLVIDSYRPGKGFRCSVLADQNDQRLDFGLQYRLKVSLLASDSYSDSIDTAYSDPLPVARPNVTGLSATKVQRTGRPVVTLFGSDLDSGSSMQVIMLSDRYMFMSSEVLTRSPSNITVRLGRFHNVGYYFVSLEVQNCSNSKRSYRQLSIRVLPDARPEIVQSSVRRCLIPSGGLPFDINAGQGLDAVVHAEMTFLDVSTGFSSTSVCSRRNRSLGGFGDAGGQSGSPGGGGGGGGVFWSCPSPMISATSIGSSQPASTSTASPSRPGGEPLRVKRSLATPYGSSFNITYTLDSLSFDYPNSVILEPDPELQPVPSQIIVSPDTETGQQLSPHELKISGRYLLPTLLPTDVTVMLGRWHCLTLTILQDVITCRPPKDESFFNQEHQVTVQIGHRIYQLGSLTFSVPYKGLMYIYIGAASFVLLCIIAASTFCVRRYIHSKDQNTDKTLEHRMNLLEAKMSQTCRDAFAELQLNSNGTDGGVYGDLDGSGGIPAPCRTFDQFACYTCFPERYESRFEKCDEIFADVVRSRNSAEDSTESQGLEELDRLLHNRLFLLTMIDALELNAEKFRHHERNQFGSLLSALLLDDMECFTDLLTRLIAQLIRRKQEVHDNYKVVFRRCDSVAERLLPNWLAFLMYEQLADKVVEPFYRLYLGIKREVYKGPVDQCTEDSKYTINEQRLLRKDIQFQKLTLTFKDRLEVLHRIGSDGEPWTCRVRVLDCDSVYQAKMKLLDAAYTALRVPFSGRQPAAAFDLVQASHNPPMGIEADVHDLPLREENVTDSEVRHLCLSDYSLSGDNIVVYLRRKPASAESNGTMYRSLVKGLANNSDTATPLLKSTSSKSLLDGGSASKSGGGGGGSYATVQHQHRASGSSSKQKAIPPRHYHLTTPYNASQTLNRSSKKKGKQSDRGQQNGQQHTVPEAYLPILLSTKKNLTDNITDLFGALFPAQEPVPLCIKFLFDQLDDIAHETGLSRDAAHIWKSNALTLRFYMQLLMNAQHLMDVEIQGPVRFCLSTVATVFMEACSVEKPATPDRNAPSQRLLFVREVADFHPKVESYYAAVRSGIREPRDEMLRKFHNQVANRNAAPFCRTTLLRELFSEFVFKFQNEILKSLSVYGGPSHGDPEAVELSKSLVSVINMLSAHHAAPTLPAPHLNQHRLQHQQQQQQRQHAPLTYQQMQLVPPYQSMSLSSPGSPYVYPTLSSTHSSNRSILQTFGHRDYYA